MTLSTLPPASALGSASTSTSDPTQPPDLILLNLTRLLARLEHNLLSPSANVTKYQNDPFQRMRLSANVEYARLSMQTLEKSLPQIKPVEKRHEMQGEMVRLRSVLRRVDGWLGGLEEEDSEEGEEAEGEDLLDTPGSGSEEDMVRDTGTGFERRDLSTGTHTDTHTHISTPTPTPIPTSSAPGPGPGPEPTPAPTTTELEPPTSTLRNRHHPPAPPPPPPAQPDHQPHHAQKSEQTLSTHRQEQEDLTTSLLSLATQLKTSTKTFQSQLESEKSILARAVDGLDRTASNMEAAERRMGLLRRMTEGKGWWGRMMLYAWIFAGWVVAILIVFVGPKVRF